MKKPHRCTARSARHFGAQNIFPKAENIDPRFLIIKPVEQEQVTQDRRAMPVCSGCADSTTSAGTLKIVSTRLTNAMTIIEYARYWWTFFAPLESRCRRVFGSNAHRCRYHPAQRDPVRRFVAFARPQGNKGPAKHDKAPNTPAQGPNTGFAQPWIKISVSWRFCSNLSCTELTIFMDARDKNGGDRSGKNRVIAAEGRADGIHRHLRRAAEAPEQDAVQAVVDLIDDHIDRDRLENRNRLLKSPFSQCPSFMRKFSFLME